MYILQNRVLKKFPPSKEKMESYDVERTEKQSHRGVNLEQSHGKTSDAKISELMKTKEEFTS